MDRFGLDYADRTILMTMIEKFGGGPVGLETLAAAIGEDSGTLEDVYEPFLLKKRLFLQRTPKRKGGYFVLPTSIWDFHFLGTVKITIQAVRQDSDGIVTNLVEKRLVFLTGSFIIIIRDFVLEGGGTGYGSIKKLYRSYH